MMDAVDLEATIHYYASYYNGKLTDSTIVKITFHAKNGQTHTDGSQHCTFARREFERYLDRSSSRRLYDLGNGTLIPEHFLRRIETKEVPVKIPAPK